MHTETFCLYIYPDACNRLVFCHTETLTLFLCTLISLTERSTVPNRPMPTNLLLNFPLAREKTLIQYSFMFLSNRRTEQKRKKQIYRKTKLPPGVTASQSYV